MRVVIAEYHDHGSIRRCSLGSSKIAGGIKLGAQVVAEGRLSHSVYPLTSAAAALTYAPQKARPAFNYHQTRWSDARQKLEHAEPSHGVSWVLGPTKHAQDVFNMCGFEELQTAVFHERDISSGEFDLERGAVVGCSEQDCLALKVNAGFAVFQNALDHVLDLRRLVGSADELGFLSRELRRKKVP